MVVALGPGKFYGSSLPRPHIYTDVKLNESRIDPPMGVFEPFLSWAHDAHWSMGGLSFKRLRLQGRIEGNIKRLRSEQKKQIKNRSLISVSSSPDLKGAKRHRFDESFLNHQDDDSDLDKETLVAAAATATATADVAVNGSSSWIGGSRLRRKRARKLVDDFDRVAESDGTPEVPWSPVEEKTIIKNKKTTTGINNSVQPSSEENRQVVMEETVASRTRNPTRRRRSPRSETTDEVTPTPDVAPDVAVEKAKSKSVGGKMRSERRTEGTSPVGVEKTKRPNKSNSVNDFHDSPPRVTRSSPRLSSRS